MPLVTVLILLFSEPMLRFTPQVDFSLSSPIFCTREYFLQDDLKQPGGQESGQEKQQGIEPWTFFSKK